MSLFRLDASIRTEGSASRALADIHNFGVSQHFKAYVDLVATDPRMADVTPATAGKPGVLVTVQGGNYSPGTPREGWDHATSWMRRILEDVWHIELDVVTREFTLVGENPALDGFADLAAHIKTGAENQAHETGLTFAGRTPTKVA